MIARLLGPTGGWKRRVALGSASLAVAAGIAVAADKPDPRTLKPQAMAVEARTIAGFEKENRSNTRFGRLEWLGGAVLTSPSPYFGGLSGFAVDSAGRRFVAVSDGGTWLSGELTYSGRHLTGLASTRIGPLLATDKKPLARGRDRDAESVTLVDGSPLKGILLIAFEGNDRVGRFAIDANGVAAPSGYIAIPPEVKKLRSVDGIEAVAVMRGGPLKGSTIALAEHVMPGDRHHAGWIFAGSAHKRFSLTDIGGFDITDAAGLADGSLVVLERRFRWTEGVKMRLRLVPATALKPGAIVAGEVLLEADLSHEIDNMEGLAAHAGADGGTILTLVSDDNFNPLFQRTVILQFALPASSVARSE